MHAADPETDIHIAIVGGGITGIALAVGLAARDVPFVVYERAASSKEVGAGIGLSPNAERAMASLDPRLLDAYNEAATPNGEDFFQWIDGCTTDKLIYQLYLGKDGFRGCRRADLLEGWVRLIPEECLRFNKQVETVVEHAAGGASLVFTDGTAERADVVIGTDGVRSRIRQLLLGEDNPAAHPSYTNKYCFRSLVPMDAAKTAIGPVRASTRFMYNGPNAHIITYPVAMGDSLNVLAVVSDPTSWPVGDRHTAPARKAEVVRAFASWHPTVRAIVGLLPDELDKWAIVDSFDCPAPTYARGVLVVAGDAAHAAGPHLGAGAAMGIEDALVLSTVLKATREAILASGGSRHDREARIRAALRSYSDVRLGRTQWLVRNTRTAADLFQWQHPEVGSDADAFAREITWRFRHIWDGDVDEMARKALDGLTSLEQADDD